MNKATFRSKSSTYEGEYDCVLRTPDKEVSPGLHYHDFYECVVYLGNGGIFHIEGQEYPVKRGDLVLIDMFRPHTLLHNKDGYYERLSVSIDPTLMISFSTMESNLLDVFHNANNHQPVYHLRDADFQKYLQLIDQLQNLSLSQGSDILQKAMVHQLMAFIYNDCYSLSAHGDIDRRHVATIAQLIKYINAHLGDELSLEKFSKEVNYSEYYICRLFKKMTQKTLTAYIQEKRIEQAAQYLREAIPINKAAEMVGFNNYSYFYKTFKRYTGVSPAEYREQVIRS